MKQLPDFDPYELLGIDVSADIETIDRAYKTRIRAVHPDVAGSAGLVETKRLNLAREWLLDPALRARLPRPTTSWWQRMAGPRSPRPPEPASRADPEPGPPASPAPTSGSRSAWAYDPLQDDPLAFDYGSQAARLRAFFESIRSLSDDERARVTYSLGDEPPVLFEEFREHVGEQLWARSWALRDAITRVWDERHDEAPPTYSPGGQAYGSGAIVANAYAQWLLLGHVIEEGWSDSDSVVRLASRCTWPWEASVGHERYGTFQREVAAFLEDAREMATPAAERLARAWEASMGRFLYGKPGEDWFPGSNDTPKPQLVSARLAAVDASRIEPPVELPWGHHSGFRHGLRLTAFVLALGGVEQPGRDYLGPWRAAMDESPSFSERARWGMPVG